MGVRVRASGGVTGVCNASWHCPCDSAAVSARVVRMGKRVGALSLSLSPSTCSSSSNTSSRIWFQFFGRGSMLNTWRCVNATHTTPRTPGFQLNVQDVGRASGSGCWTCQLRRGPDCNTAPCNGSSAGDAVAALLVQVHVSIWGGARWVCEVGVMGT